MITKALLEAQSPRLTGISEKMAGKSSIGDPTELERYKAPKTPFFRLFSSTA